MKHENSGFKYEEKEDGTIRISRVINKYLKNIVIPQQINGKTVTEIGPFAFYGCKNLATLEIPASVTEIEELAFKGCDILAIDEIDDPSILTIIAPAGSYAEEWMKREKFWWNYVEKK